MCVCVVKLPKMHILQTYLKIILYLKRTGDEGKVEVKSGIQEEVCMGRIDI